MIDAQVIENLMDAELVIADLSMMNPNAFYEVGIRHMVQKPIIHMQLKDDEIPFDVSLYRAIKFSHVRPSELRNARGQLRDAINSVLASDYKVDNPVIRTRGQIRLEQHATPEQRALLERLEAIEKKLESSLQIDGREKELFRTIQELKYSRRELENKKDHLVSIAEKLALEKNVAEEVLRKNTDIIRAVVSLDNKANITKNTIDKIKSELNNKFWILNYEIKSDSVIFDLYEVYKYTQYWDELENYLKNTEGVKGVSFLDT